MNSLDYAIQIETNGAGYYREQANLHTGTTLERIFNMLAEEEERHKLLLKDVEENVFSTLPANDLSMKDTLFSGLGQLKDEIRDTVSQLEIYQFARAMEEKSIALYTELLKDAVDEKERALLMFIEKQERLHADILDELVVRISRPEEWVESAEFGPREEY